MFARRPRLEVQPILHTPRPGDVLAVRLDIDAPRRMPLQEGRIDLRLRATYRTGDRQRGTLKVARREDLVSERVQFLPGGELEAGARTVDLTLRIPDDVPPPFEGDLIRLEWGIVATLALPRRRDVSASATIHVVGDPPASADGEAEGSGVTAWGELMIRVAPQVLRQGETFAVTVDVAAREAIAGPALRVELRHVEEVRLGAGASDTDIYGQADLAPQRPFGAGERGTLTATLAVPAQPGVPTIELESASARWEVVVFDGGRELCALPVDVWSAAPRRAETEAAGGAGAASGFGQDGAAASSAPRISR